MSLRAWRLVLAAVLSLPALAPAGDLVAPPPPEAEWPAIEKARTLLDEGRFAEAEAALAGTGSVAAQLQRAHALAWQGRPAEAAALMRRVAAATHQPLDPQAPSAWVLLAATWKAPPAALAHHARGFWLSQRDRCQEAKVELEQALQLAPTLADARYHLGYCLDKLGDQAGFERETRAAIAGYSPGERVLRASAEYGLGNWLVQQGPGRAREAQALLRSATGPGGLARSPGVLVALGQAQAATGDVAASQATFAEVLERLERGEEPGFPGQVAAELSRDLYGAGCRRRPASASPDLLPVCASAAAREQLGLGYEAATAGKLAEAEAPLRRAVALEPTLGMAWASLGAVLLQQQRAAEAVPALEKAVANPGYLDARGRAYDLLNLAGALLQAGRSGAEAQRLSGEAARLLEAEVSRSGLAPARRADLDLGIGRAFMLAGNGPCAVQRLDAVAGRTDTPEAYRKRAQELLASMRPPGAPRELHCFEFELYRPTTLKAQAARSLAEHPPRKVGSQPVVANYHPPERYQARVRFTGRERTLPPERAKRVNGLYRPWEATRRIPELPGGQVVREIEVEEGGSLRWVPIQEGLVEALRAERGGGGPVDLFVMFLGDLDGDPAFIAGEFRAVK